MQLQPGTTLCGGKYRIERVLGQGGFGITYLATTEVAFSGELGSIKTKINVAIKEFYMREMNQRDTDGSSVVGSNSTLVTDYRRKFRREAENLGRLNHPNIVKVLEVFDENNTTYYAMEYIDGENLDKYIKSKKHLSEKEAKCVMLDLCDALAYMHHQGMLHLDLKPKNIMRNSEGKYMLIDFGLSKQFNENGEPESSTSLGLGTPGYAPLEQSEQNNYKHKGTLPSTIDIYALGATLYKMLTGKTPPTASSVLNDGLPIEELKANNVSSETIALIEKAMSPMRKQRYQSAEELKKACDGIEDDETCIEEIEAKSAIADADIITSEVQPSNSIPQQQVASTDITDEVVQNNKSNKKLWITVIIVLITALIIGIAMNQKTIYNYIHDNSDEWYIEDSLVEVVEEPEIVADSVEEAYDYDEYEYYDEDQYAEPVVE